MEQRRFAREGAEFGRGLGFLDAIYGFAITLLVTNIELPPAADWSDLSSLLSNGLGWQLVGFIISFVVIATFWRHNTVLLSRFSAIDGAIITANLVAVGLVVLLPFTTQGISDPELSDLPLPVALYAVNVMLAMLGQTAILEVGRRRGLIDVDAGPATVRAQRVDVAAKIVVFIASIPVAYLVGPVWGMMTWWLLAVVGPLTGRWYEKVAARERALAAPASNAASTE